MSTAFVNCFCLFKKNCHGGKNRNSRPELEKLNHKIYIEPSGDLSSLVKAEPCQFVHASS